MTIQYQMHALELVRNHIHYQNTYILLFIILRASLTAQTVKASACNAGDLGSIPGSGRSPGEGNGNPLQHSGLENPKDRGAG